MKRFRNSPDPLDEHDPRVIVEWTDKLGNKIRPGDIVGCGFQNMIRICQVIQINALRKDGQPFTYPKPQMIVQPLDNNFVPRTHLYHSGWNGNSYTLTEERPILWTIKFPDDAVIKVEM